MRHLPPLEFSFFLVIFKFSGKRSKNSSIANGSLMMVKRLGFAVSVLDDSPLFLGTYISLAILVGGLGVFFMEEKAVPKLVIISSSLSILVEL